MALATWWKGDTLSKLSPLTNFHATLTDNIDFLVRTMGVEQKEIAHRLNTYHSVYIAWLNDEAVGYGWLASRTGSVVEIGLRFELPERNKYLWDFTTFAQWRGKGVYPHLLQAIIKQEINTTDRFWIMYAPHNQASASGIRKAGFNFVADLAFSAQGKIQLLPLDASKRTCEATTLFEHFLR